MRDMYTNGDYKSLTEFDLSDGDTFTLVVTNAAQWRKNADEVFVAFEDCASFCNAEEAHFDVQIKDQRATGSGRKQSSR